MSTQKTETANYSIIPFEELQGFIHWRIKKTYTDMLGKGGFEKEQLSEVSTAHIPASWNEFHEEAYSELSLIYCQAVETYDPSREIEFIGWFGFKARDLEGRLWRLFSHGCNVKHHEDYAQRSVEADLLDFRLSLSPEATELLALLETGQGFTLDTDKPFAVSVHMGMKAFWRTYLPEWRRDDLIKAWNELRKEYKAIGYNDQIIVITDM